MKHSAALLLLLAGCSTLHAPPSTPPVPFIAQQPNHCGPAALAMVAGYYGQPMSQNDIPTGPRGALTTDLLAHAGTLGLWARQYWGDRADLRQKLAAGIPLIVRGRFGDNDHYFVALALNPFRQIITVHTDARPGWEMSVEDFDRFWERGGRWTLLVCPPARATWTLSADEHNDLGVFLERRDQPAAAAGHYRAALALAPTNSYYALNLGNALLQQKLFPEAVAAFQQAGENPDALNNLAYTYAQLGRRLDEAAALCRRAIALRPTQRAYYLDTLAGILLQQGNPRDAMAAYEQALAATTDRQSALRAGIRQRLATARALVEK